MPVEVMNLKISLGREVAFVGASVDCQDGYSEGESVGSKDGNNVGTSVESNDGHSDGAGVKNSSFFDGANVGTLDGCKVGDKLESLEGSSVGYKVGKREGCAVRGVATSPQAHLHNASTQLPSHL